jgi:hypothetical protein
MITNHYMATLTFTLYIADFNNDGDFLTLTPDEGDMVALHQGKGSSNTQWAGGRMAKEAARLQW